jgi:hypothetical protein
MSIEIRIAAIRSDIMELGLDNEGELDFIIERALLDQDKVTRYSCVETVYDCVDRDIVSRPLAQVVSSLVQNTTGGVE